MDDESRTAGGDNNAAPLPETEPAIDRDALKTQLGLTDLTVKRASAGHSNITYFLSSGERRLVLRRPPRGPLAPGAHDVLREYRILSGLEGFEARAPKAVAACDDGTVIGAPFYVMERVDGLIVDGATPPPLNNRADRDRIGRELVDTLLELHALPWQGSKLAEIGRPDGYLRRQVDLWGEQWQRGHTREVPSVDAVGTALAREIPDADRTTLVHGDYKLDNVIFAPASPARLLAVLDWEMATLGDPLADLGFLTATWLQGDDPDRLLGLSPASAEPGYPTRTELVERYTAGTDLSVERLAWYQALALWKLAILLEASYRRFRAGATQDPLFARLESGVPNLAVQAAAALDGALLED